MASSLAYVKQEWRLFHDDAPGSRFFNHRERMKRKSRTHATVAFALGVLTLVAGVILLFIPGPGTPLVVFGLALVATHSKPMSHALDRAELALRRLGHRVAAGWKALPKWNKAALVTGGLVLFSCFLMATWKWVVAAYLL